MVFFGLFSVGGRFAADMGFLASDPISQQVANLYAAPMALCPNDWVRSSAVQCGDMWGVVDTYHALSNEDFVDPLISLVGRDYQTRGRVIAGKSRFKDARCIATPCTRFTMNPLAAAAGSNVPA